VIRPRAKRRVGPTAGSAVAQWESHRSKVVALLRSPMRITQCGEDVMVALGANEASRLMDACAMVVLAAESVPSGRLPADLAGLLCDLFEGLQASTYQPQGITNSLKDP